MAGPWFAVHELADDEETEEWLDYGRVWLSDGGTTDGQATLQMRATLAPLIPGGDRDR